MEWIGSCFVRRWFFKVHGVMLWRMDDFKIRTLCGLNVGGYKADRM